MDSGDRMSSAAQGLCVTSDQLTRNCDLTTPLIRGLIPLYIGIPLRLRVFASKI
jgi:hypothetical protein